MRYIFLTEQFYKDYADCSEIERKENRPYMALAIEIDGYTFAIPFRSHISHKHSFITDVENRCGLDYSKTVVVLKNEYISDIRPTIRPNEHAMIIGKEYEIQKGLRKYIRTYKKAALHREVPRNQMLCQYSTLQYFEAYL